MMQMLYSNRERHLDGADIEVPASVRQASPKTETGHPNRMISRSPTLGANNFVNLTNPFQDCLASCVIVKWGRILYMAGRQCCLWSSGSGSDSTYRIVESRVSTRC